MPVRNIVDVYTYLSSVYNLGNYRIVNLSSVLGLKDVPTYILKFISEENQCLGIFDSVNPNYCILRSLKDKRFVTVGSCTQIPYGMRLFDNFKYGDLLVVVEGLKDRDSLAQIYPYTIAAQSSSLSIIAKKILELVTNNILLLYDNDDAGNKGSYRDMRYFSQNISINKGRHPLGVKDCGTMVDILYRNNDTYTNSIYKEYYKNLIKSYGGVVK